ncbi:putative membrane protein [Nocardia nova SH22a]|uniref:Putative membrane protein n=1 Tax=Nocardia nova SH22a TaxID=1415166 RepID=W5TWJ6_9NOCA|nr:MHYT domain-containing protein [Nocardia nova]AHH21551.1 putative membrane protein [Nocardia nova SH22a]
MNFFTMGYWVLGLAIGVAAAGAVVGLACIRQSTLSVTARFRMVWLTAAAVSIGGVGTWLAVYVTMLGVGVSTGEIRYDLTRMVVAAVVAVAAVLAGLLIAGRAGALPRVVGGGVVMGIGIGIMHMLAMGAVHVQGSADTTLWLSLTAGALAIAVSIGLIWATANIRAMLILVGVGVLYALAITAVHYLGQAGLRVHPDGAAVPPEGDDLFTLFVPVFITGTLSLAVPITAVLVAPDRTGTTRSRQAAQAANTDSMSAAGRASGRAPQPVG